MELSLRQGIALFIHILSTVYSTCLSIANHEGHAINKASVCDSAPRVLNYDFSVQSTTLRNDSRINVCDQDACDSRVYY